MLDELKKNKRFMEGAFYVVLLVGLVVLDKVFSLAMVIFPLAGIIISAVYLAKKGSPELRPYIPAVSVQSGHYLWMIVVYLIAGQLIARIFDLAIMVLGLRWLIRSPGKGPVILLSVYNIFLLISFYPALMTGLQADNILSVKAICLHLLLSLLSIAFMAYGYFRVFKYKGVEPLPQWEDLDRDTEADYDDYDNNDRV